MSKSIKTTCPYCGVGCGIVADVSDSGEIRLRGDDDHPSNHGRLCSKGAALTETLSLEGRLLHPEIGGRRVTWDEALAAVADGFSRIIREHGADAVAFYGSGQLLTEDYYVANKLMKGFIGSANIDTNSRLCMASSVAGHKRAFGADTVPACYEDLERAKLIVLVGSNTAWCHPVLFQRIVAAKGNDPELKVVVIDPRRTATCDIADLHLPLRPGSDVSLFNGLLGFLHRHGFTDSSFVDAYTEGVEEALACSAWSDFDALARACGLSADDLVTFFDWFASTERVVSVYSQGVNQSASGTDKVNAIINCHLLTGRIGRSGMGPFSFTGQPNAMGGREVGGLANQLAAHMELDNSDHRALVQRFWGSPCIAERPGLKAVELFQGIEEGRVKAVWIMGTNPVVTLPDADRVRRALAQCELVVVSDCVNPTDTTRMGHVLLPAATWGEKDGTVTNSERRISRQRPFLAMPGESRPDWWIITEVARRMGFADAFRYDRPAQIFREHAGLSAYHNDGSRDFDIGGLAGVSDIDYERLAPMQWPIDAGGGGTQRMFSDGRFFHASGKARFVRVTPRAPQHAPDADFPLVLNTGRVRDQWHTMTRTGKAPRLSEHTPEPYAEMHPDDAASVGAVEGELAQVASRWGAVIVRLRLSDAQRRGSIFVPMHWNDQFSARARVDAVVNPVVDPVSGQPESKHTPVRVTPYRPAWHGFILSRRELDLQGVHYWTRAAGAGCYRYEIAGNERPPAWPVWARGLLGGDQGADWVEYVDAGASDYRGARLVGGRLESCLFVSATPRLPPRRWLAGLFAQPRLADDERAALLSGRPPSGDDVGRIVCACFGVGLNAIVEAVRDRGLSTPEAVGAALKAGTNCGSCVPEIKALIQACQSDNAA